MAGACAEFNLLGTNNETGVGGTNNIFKPKEPWNKVLLETLNNIILNSWFSLPGSVSHRAISYCQQANIYSQPKHSMSPTTIHQGLQNNVFMCLLVVNINKLRSLNCLERSKRKLPRAWVQMIYLHTLEKYH